MSDTPAFPALGFERRADGNFYQNPTIYNGLTKREYFAAMAMQGFCANPISDDAEFDALALWSLGAADALLAVLKEDDQ